VKSCSAKVDMDGSVRGMALTVLAGAVGSSTLMPFKYVRGWKWENTWLTYSFLAYLVFPWLAAILTVPGLLSAYHHAGWGTVSLVGLFGLGWGASVVLYGLALEIVGLSLTSGIILGCSVAIGSLVPLLLLQSHRLLTLSGLHIVGADLLMVVGVLLCARAGELRERPEHDINPKPPHSRFVWGLLVCFISGMLAPLLNITLAVGAGITRHALAVGARPFYAANGVWGLAVSMGALPSLGTCFVKLFKNQTWSRYANSRDARNYLLCFAMGLFFILSTVIYGAAAGELGTLGPVLGWPVYMSSLIIGNNFWGWYTGEWADSGSVAVRTMFLGIALQIVAMVLLGMAR
jgi:L-rhamnose-H+ transport protein